MEPNKPQNKAANQADHSLAQATVANTDGADQAGLPGPQGPKGSNSSGLIQRIITTFSNYSSTSSSSSSSSSSSASTPGNPNGNPSSNHNSQSTNLTEQSAPDGSTNAQSAPNVQILSSNEPHPIVATGPANITGTTASVGHGKQQTRAKHRHAGPLPHPPLNHNPQLTHSVKSTKFSTPVLSISSLISLTPSSPNSMLLPCDQFNSLKALIDMGNRSVDTTPNDTPTATLTAQPVCSSADAAIKAAKVAQLNEKPIVELVVQSPPMPRTGSSESTMTSFASSESNSSPPNPPAAQSGKARHRWSPTGQVIVTGAASSGGGGSDGGGAVSSSTGSHHKEGHHGRKPSRLNSKNNKFKRTKRNGNATGSGHHHGSTGSGGSAGSVKSNYRSPSNKSPAKNRSPSNKSATSLSSLSSYIISKSSLNLEVFSSNIRNGENFEYDAPIHYNSQFPGFERGTQFFGPSVLEACRNGSYLGVGSWLSVAQSEQAQAEGEHQYPSNFENPIRYDTSQLKQYQQVSQKIATRLSSMFSRKSKLQPKQKRFKPINNNNSANKQKTAGEQAINQDMPGASPSNTTADKSDKLKQTPEMGSIPMPDISPSVTGSSIVPDQAKSANASSSSSPVKKVSKRRENPVGRTYSCLSVDSQKSMYNQTSVRKSLACCRANSMSTVSILSRGGSNTVMAKSLSQADLVTPPEVLIRGYLFTRQIATGSYSILYESNRPSNPTRKFACKHMRTSEINNSVGMLRDFVDEELKILSLVNHENIIDLFEIINTSTDVFIFMKFAVNGTILDYLYKFWRKPLPETYCKRWMMDLFKALAYIHGIMVCHRDLKLENFLLDEKYNALLSDFGMAVSLKTPNASALLSVQCGTTDYLAPEVHMAANCSNSYYDPFPADMYAMGICLFEMANYFRPFAISISETNRTLIYRQKNRRYAFNNRIYLTEECHQVLHDLLEPKPQKRPQASRILEHEWFKTGNR